ncbi:hypothetical protein ONZ45_g12377 [Pleurotus djamor]|nr:hypothetical protein ONZ45_g12377 [Pleurotus djamor]
MFIAPNLELHRRAGALASPSLAGSSTSSTTSGTSSMFDSHFSSSTDMSSPDEDAHKMVDEGGSYGNSYSMTRSNSAFFSRDCDPSTPTQFSFKRDKNILELRVDIPFHKTAARNKFDSSSVGGARASEAPFQAISVSPDIERQRSASHEEICQPPKVVLRPQEMPESPSPIMSLPSPYLSHDQLVRIERPTRHNAGSVYVGLGLALPSDGSPEASVPSRPKLTRSTSSRRHLSYLAEKVQLVAVSPLLHKLQKVTIGSPKSPHSPTASPPFSTQSEPKSCSVDETPLNVTSECMATTRVSLTFVSRFDFFEVVSTRPTFTHSQPAIASLTIAGPETFG